ncbi:MAG: TonB family protein [Candidatus Sulfotelmatobacter sp.]
MGYQALLFCPDEKTARTVTQVLSELDFIVTPCTEPFAAVKKLMGEHFDAVVVDCDNEQNATLLFKSARNTSNNQSSLAVAVVEGQAGVAKAFRIGANLVLTKPINVEQAKGTLRVARGLLRKNEAAKPAAAAASANPVAPAPQPSTQATISSLDAARHAAITRTTPSVAPEKSQGAVASTSTNLAESRTEVSESATEKIISPGATQLSGPQAQVPEIGSSSVSPKAEMAASRAGFGMSAGSAPAPARDPKAGVPTEDKPSAVASQPETIARISDHEIKPPVERESAPAPMFTFGGTVGGEAESASGGKKKLVLAIGAAVLIATGAYAAWAHWGRPNDTTPVPDHVADSPVKTPVPVPQAAPSQAKPGKPSATDTLTSATADGEDVESHPSKLTAATDSSKPSPSSVAANEAPATKQDAEPIVIKNNLSRPAPKLLATAEAPAPPSMAGIAPAGNGGGLPNLMDTQSQAPTPVLQTVTVSQGVSQGLLVKKVQPKYPPSALRLRVEGGVQLLATISKNGDISAVRILSGDTQLSHAAVDAVKQWKYKPYLLNGEPVEIQTQITVNFKLPN